MTEQTEKNFSGFRVWLLASRPKTLPAAISPVIIGTAMAFYDGRLHILSALLAAAGALLIQIGTNFANDYFDFFKGVDDKDRLGPLRATQAGLVDPQKMKRAFIIVFLSASLAGGYLVYRGGWPVVIIGALSILCGIAYTGGPYPLGYNGLGDLFVLIFFGPVAVGGTYYVQALEINRIVLLAGLAPGLLSVAILTVNNLRDIYTDKKAGKKTLPVRFGENFARWEYLLCLILSCLIIIPLILQTRAHFLSLSVFIILLPAVPSIKIIFKIKPGIIFNKVLAGTGQLLFIYSILFSIGWIL